MYSNLFEQMWLAMACCDRSGPALFRGCLSGSLQRGPQRSCERLQDLFFVSFGPYAFLFDICQYLWLWYIVYIYHLLGSWVSGTVPCGRLLLCLVCCFWLSARWLSLAGCSSGAERSAKVKLLLWGQCRRIVFWDAGIRAGSCWYTWPPRHVGRMMSHDVTWGASLWTAFDLRGGCAYLFLCM